MSERRAARPDSPGRRPPSPSAPGAAQRSARRETRADVQRARVAEQRRSAASAAKAERAAREALILERQTARCASAHENAATARSNSILAVSEQAELVQRGRHNAAAEVKRTNTALRGQLEMQRAGWSLHGRQLHERAVATREAARENRRDMQETHLDVARRDALHRGEACMQASYAYSSLVESKRQMAGRVRAEAGPEVVRQALQRAAGERSASASRVRARSVRDTLAAELDSSRVAERNMQSAMRVERAASPLRVRQRKQAEAERKRSETGGLRAQGRALEALALERRQLEAEWRRAMHDAVVAAKYPERDGSDGADEAKEAEEAAGEAEAELLRWLEISGDEIIALAGQRAGRGGHAADGEGGPRQRPGSRPASARPVRWTRATSRGRE